MPRPDHPASSEANPSRLFRCLPGLYLRERDRPDEALYLHVDSVTKLPFWKGGTMKRGIFAGRVRATP